MTANIKLLEQQIISDKTHLNDILILFDFLKNEIVSGKNFKRQLDISQALVHIFSHYFIEILSSPSTNNSKMYVCVLLLFFIKN